MDKIVIHVGLHKTASTFFQNKIWPGVENYRYIGRPYTQHNHAFNKLQYADGSLYDSSEVGSQIDKIKENKLLLSDESFSGKPYFFSYINRAIIAERLKELFPDANIVLFIRDQKDILLSIYNQYIKIGAGVKRMEDLFWYPRKDYSLEDYRNRPFDYDLSTLYFNTNQMYIHLDSFLYSPLVELFRSLFKNVSVFLFEDISADWSGIKKRLENILEEKINIDSAGIQDKVNVSLSPQLLEQIRLGNILSSIARGRLLRRCASGVAKIASRLRKLEPLTGRVDKIVGKHYSNDNANLKKLLPDLNWDRHPDKYS
ncbi:MAG: hypothetical protein ACYS8W_13735 [Planctomycetota bacterium]|jgi:hypothetical protein